MDTERPWYEDDSFWETWRPFLFPPQRIQNTVDEVDKIVKLLGITPEIRILDLGCGVGRHSLELARRGYKITGVDRTENYLRQARGQAAGENLDIEFVKSDMRAFSRPGAFEAAVNLFTTFGYFEDSSDDRKVIKNIIASLKPGGIFLMDIISKEVLAKMFQKRTWVERDGVLLLQEHNLSRNWSWMDNRWIMIRNDKRLEYRVSHRLYAASEIMALFSENGFSRTEIYGDLEGHPYDETAQRLVAVGWK
jgi:SAM-dependent methyltransferase